MLIIQTSRAKKKHTILGVFFLVLIGLYLATLTMHIQIRPRR